MAKFNVTKIVPEGFMHTSAFNEVIESLSWSLAVLGHDVNVTQNWLSEHQETNIIFGAEVMADFQKLPRNTIIFNLEQPSHPNMEKVRKLAAGLTVWDFSPRNIKDWHDRGFDCRHVPIGYTPNLTRIPRAQTQDIDVFFCGWLTPRRVALIDQLRAAGLKVFASAACYGGGRDNLISRSKICLNVHHDGRDMFEIVRCSYLMANSKCVVSEESVDDQDYSLAVSCAPYRVLVDTCKTLVGNDHIRKQREGIALTDIRDRDFTQSVAAALEGSDAHELSQPIRAVTGGSPSGERVSKVEFKPAWQAGVSEHYPPLNPIRLRYQDAEEAGDMRDFLHWMREHAHGNILEIGVRDGASTSAFLLGLEEHGGHLYSVDVQPMPHPFPPHSQWTFIQANSTNIISILKQIPYELDILLIDGDHSRAGVIADFQYARQLRPGGMVLFHDILPEAAPSGCTDMSWPSDDVKNVFAELSTALGTMGWTSEILPGRYGMGVLRKPA